MSCPIHDRCTCYAASLHCAASLTTTTASSQLVPQTNNILVGYEWAPPFNTTTMPWYPFESVLIQPPMPRSGQEISGTVAFHNSHHPEPRVDEREQKPFPSHEQVRFPSCTPPQAYPKLVCDSTSASYTIHPGRYPNVYAQQSLRYASSSSSK